MTATAEVLAAVAGLARPVSRVDPWGRRRPHGGGWVEVSDVVTRCRGWSAAHVEAVVTDLVRRGDLRRAPGGLARPVEDEAAERERASSPAATWRSPWSPAPALVVGSSPAGVPAPSSTKRPA